MTVDNPFSLLIIVKNRRRHVENILKGLAHSSRLPSEIIIVHMNEDSYGLSYEGASVNEYTLTDDSPLPLAKARNLAAKKARHDQLVFLDADCIPAPNFFEQVLADLRENRVVMCDPYYLQNPVDSIDFTAFEQEAAPNLARKEITYGASDKYELFWSLGFAVHKQNFDGFDESYTGYGAEDTDFGFSLRKMGTELFFSKAKVFHQPHGSHSPPLNWLEDIIANAKTFRAKWGIWPMEGWLQAFVDHGYIEWSDEKITLIKLPTEAEIEAVKR